MNSGKGNITHQRQLQLAKHTSQKETSFYQEPLKNYSKKALYFLTLNNNTIENHNRNLGPPSLV